MGKRDSARKLVSLLWLDLRRSEDELVSFVASMGMGLDREIKAGLIGKSDSERKVVSLEWLDFGRSEDRLASFAAGEDVGREMPKAGLIGRVERRRDGDDWGGLVACSSDKGVSRVGAGLCSSTARPPRAGSLGPSRLDESMEQCIVATAIGTSCLVEYGVFSTSHLSRTVDSSKTGGCSGT